MENFDGKKVKNVWLFKHGHRGRKEQMCSATYSTWTAMLARCSNEKNDNYHLYGGAGISVCSEWRDSFIKFLEDMGERPRGKTIDRIDPSLGYFKDNCRWATNKEQARNRVTTNKIELFGEIVYAPDLIEKYGVSQTTMYRRIKAGLTGEDLIKKPRPKRKSNVRPQRNSTLSNGE